MHKFLQLLCLPVSNCSASLIHVSATTMNHIVEYTSRLCVTEVVLSKLMSNAKFVA